jgi:invasion protein IalB
MRVSKRAGVAKILLAVGIVLLSQAALTQTLQPKTRAANEPEAAIPPQPEAGQAAPQQPTWSMNCANRNGGLDCRAVQSLFMKSTGRRLLSVVVHVPPDTKKPELLLQLPLGIYLPAGASLQIGKDEAKTVPFKSCDQFGCLAEYAITEAEIAALSNGQDLKLTMVNLQNEPITLTVPSLGFADAYAKVK